ncbi:MAG: hypothetical protein D6698_07650 [Gammaproteobacteria bacterium]|nr:MAG: hypothetical protein D6698_07650 [Gammaproteobacteria bacterium]
MDEWRLESLICCIKLKAIFEMTGKLLMCSEYIGYPQKLWITLWKKWGQGTGLLYIKPFYLD